MTTPFPFVASSVLEASQLNAITTLPIATKTANYVAVVGDVGKRIVMNMAGANTITINNSIFSEGDTIFLANKGAGATTITAGAGVTINTSGSLVLAQYGGGTLVALSASVFTFFSGAAKDTLAVDFMLSGGGAGGGEYEATGSGGGGGSGGFVTGSGIIGKTTYTIKIGAGGTGGNIGRQVGQSGNASAFLNAANGGGGGGGNSIGFNGASGGGSANGAAGTGISGEGFAGGLNSVSLAGGGGGGGSAAIGGNGATTTGGAGGTATINNYTGANISYSGGGGGGGNVTGGAAGTNAGAGGGNAAGSNGTANRGGGGGGGGDGEIGGNGGSGQVVIRYLTADATGLTITTTGSPTTGTDGSYSFIQYTATGTLVVA